jgi:hypothetical protein
MARSPYQGTWQQGIRPTIVTAPDALVFINGEIDVLGCSQCQRRFDIQKYITSIQVDLNVDSPPGSASINLSIPRHTIDDFYFEGVPLISPMMEVEIYAKGYFTLEGLPQYYPIFWGLTTEISDQYAGGEHTVSINCSDILKWWELCKMNINPSFTGGQFKGLAFGNIFHGMNPYDVIWTLAQQSFGDVVVGTGSLTSFFKENSQKQTFQYALRDIMQYWNERFTRIRSNMMLYGTEGASVRGDYLYARYKAWRAGIGTSKKDAVNQPFASAVVREANGGALGSQMIFDPTSSSVVAFRTQMMEAGQVNFWQSEYQTKLELANAAKEAIGYEFFMDVTGDIVFKPPFYNLDVLSNKPVSWIQDIDIINWDFSESEAEVVTQLSIQGNYTGGVDWGMGEETTPFTSVTDYHLLRKYGWRTQTFNSEFMASPKLMFYMGLDLMDRYNARRHRSTVNIPLRPELRLGFPVYVAPKDQMWYVQGISHNIQFGGQAQTTLTLSARRQKFVAPQGIGTIRLTNYEGPPPSEAPATQLQDSNPKPSVRQLRAGGAFKLTIGEAALVPPVKAQDTGNSFNPYAPLILRHPKTGRIVGYPNVVMTYTRPFASELFSEEQLARAEGRKPSPRDNPYLKDYDEVTAKNLADTERAMITQTTEDRIRDKHLSNRYSYGLNSAGVYTYAHDVSKVLEEILLIPKSKITVETLEEDEATASVLGKQRGSAMIRPVSDSRGFEVIGHYKYGRGISLRDGSLVLSGPNNTNQQANVDLQLALSGGLYETLKAQSQGLTGFVNTYPNPSDAVARLAPEELQTAAVVNPDTKEPEFVEVGKNFVDAAPLGSAANEGVPVSVEAGQLSRALTLAEMRVREDSIEATANCNCLSGRADLSFINVGYQVKVLSGGNAQGDLSQLPGDQGLVSFGAGLDEEGQQRREEAHTAYEAALEQARIEAQEVWDETFAKEMPDAYVRRQEERWRQDQITREQLEQVYANNTNYNIDEPSSSVAKRETAAKAKADAAAQETRERLEGEALAAYQEALGTEGIDGTIAEQALYDSYQEDGGPIDLRGAALGQQQLNQVEQFLVTLYEALDAPHQQYEKALRGELLDVPNKTANEIRFDNPADTGLSPLEPPYSQPNRALGGDPIALANQISSNADQVAESWSTFGTRLQENAQRSQIEAEISRDTQRLNGLREEQERLQRAQTAGGVRYTGIPLEDLPSRRAEVDDQIVRTEQNIARNQARIIELNNSNP